jgi:hypothetical protein
VCHSSTKRISSTQLVCFPKPVHPARAGKKSKKPFGDLFRESLEVLRWINECKHQAADGPSIAAAAAASPTDTSLMMVHMRRRERYARAPRIEPLSVIFDSVFVCVKHPRNTMASENK